MKIEVKLETLPQALFAKYLAAQGIGDVADLFFHLFHEAAMSHPDWRECSDPTCGSEAWPVCVVRESKYVPHHDSRHSITTEPAEVCPQCGAPTVGLEDALRIQGAPRGYVVRMVGLAALAQPQRPAAAAEASDDTVAAVGAKGGPRGKRAKATPAPRTHGPIPTRAVPGVGAAQ